MSEQESEAESKFEKLTKNIALMLDVEEHKIDFSKDFENTGWKCDRTGGGNWEKMFDYEFEPLPANRPKLRQHCYCTTMIHWNHLIRYKPTGKLLVVGNMCIRYMGIPMHRRCVQCGEHNRNTSSIRCSKCRVKCKLHDEYHDDNQYCGDKPPKRVCIDCGEANRTHTSRCKDCRTKCKHCKVYHDDNHICAGCRSCGKITQLCDNQVCLDCRVWCSIHDTFHENNKACKFCSECAEAKPLLNSRCESCWDNYREELRLIREQQEKEKRREEMMSKKIKFGMHKGKQYKEIGISYLRWLFKTVDNHEWLGEFLED